MASQYIKLQTADSNKHQYLILNTAQQARMFVQNLTMMQQLMAAMVDGSDYSQLEANFGLPTGRGADVAYLVNSLRDQLLTDNKLSLFASWFGE